MSYIDRCVELCRQGWSAQSIAQALNMRQQHVRNILIAKGERLKPLTPTPVRQMTTCPHCGSDVYVDDLDD